MKVKKNYEELDNDFISELSNEFKLDKQIINYLLYLGYTNKNSIQTFLTPDLSLFHSPFELSGINDAVSVIKNAIAKKQRILIFGDYDVDGIGATSVLVKYFKSINLDVDYFLPSRYDDGYGLTIETVDKVIDLFNPELIITVDCGISCYNEIEYIKSKGINIIVTDHHDIPETIPDCIVINPKLSGQTYPFKNLCGAGVALKLIYALSDLNTALKYFSIVAISTISDVVELRDENRLIVKYGLENFNKDLPIGILELLNILKINNLSTYDISYKLAPKLNAAGRMGDATIALKLYLENDINKIHLYISQLLEINAKRQDCCQQITKEATNKVVCNNLNDYNIIVIEDDNWECGVLGIVAAKLAETYRKPVIVLTFDKRVGRYVGSARSITGINIHNIISKCEEFLSTFGGHAMACGLSVERDKLESFKNLLYSIVIENSLNEYCESFDMQIEPNKVNVDFINQLNMLEPTGIGNPKPITIVKSSSINVSFMKNHNNHLNLNIDNLNIIGFNASKYFYDLLSNDNKILFLNLSNETYMNKLYAKAYLNKYINIDTKGLNQEIINGNMIKQFVKSNVEIKPEILLYSQLNLLTEKTLFISFNNDINDLSRWVNIDKINYCYFKDENYNSTLLISPNTIQNYNVKNIVLISLPLNNGIYNEIIKQNQDSKLYIIPATINIPWMKLSYERKTFAICYNDILKFCDNVYYDDYHFYKTINTKAYKFAQFVLCYKVFEELGIIKIEYEKNKFKIEITGQSANLEDSIISKKLKEATGLNE